MDKDMFSGLGQILKPTVRQAEETDTHLYLQKHQRDENRKKRDQQKDKENYFDTEDRASVSLDALHAFISNMLAENAHNNEAVKTSGNQPLHEQTPARKNNNIQTAKAADAYAHAAETSKSAAVMPHDNYNANTKNDKDEFLYNLLKEIEILKARNIEEIYIEKADTFQESLVNAIMNAKAQ